MAQQTDIADGVCSVHDKKLLSGRLSALLSLQMGAEHHNEDIIHESDADFNAYFRQNAKLDKMADGQLSICAKQPKIPLYFPTPSPTPKAHQRKSRNYTPIVGAIHKSPVKGKSQQKACTPAVFIVSLYW